MAWNEARSRKRIQEHLKTVPQFDDHIALAKAVRALAEDRGLMSRLPSRKASVVEGAHIYGQLLDFDDLVADRNQGETERSHRNILRFLNMHYRLWDAIVDNDDADRVDYHGARLHAIVTSPEGNPQGQVERAVALASKLNDATKRVAAAYGFPARIRFGIDQGKCLAMTTGRAYEKDTLFFGPPANHAAKLAAARDEEGIYVAPGAQTAAGATASRKTLTGDMAFDEQFVAQAARRYSFTRLDEAVTGLIAEARQEVLFVFHRHTPPLANVSFSQLSPANSVRMGMASIFADIDGFTAFVDAAIRSGSDGIKHAATAVHVIREELNDVLKEDGGGKRVRFIGDCIQGVMAEGRLEDDPPLAIEEAVKCASGMKDSFLLCRKIIGGIDRLDLAIGIEFGPVPLTRIGLRGENSVRCAAGRAVVVAEQVQQSLEGGGIKLGPEALRLATPATRRLFANTTALLGYAATVDLLSSPSSPAVAIVRKNPIVRPHCR
jgi:Adenylate and Guanylate cyclase catalytic domain